MRAFVRLYGDEDRETFLVAIRRHRGVVARARRDLGLSHKSMYRYIVRLRLWEAIDEARGVDGSAVDYEALYASAVPQSREGEQHLQVAMERRRSMG